MVTLRAMNEIRPHNTMEEINNDDDLIEILLHNNRERLATRIQGFVNHLEEIHRNNNDHDLLDLFADENIGENRDITTTGPHDNIEEVASFILTQEEEEAVTTSQPSQGEGDLTEPLQQLVGPRILINEAFRPDERGSMYVNFSDPQNPDEQLTDLCCYYPERNGYAREITDKLLERLHGPKKLSISEQIFYSTILLSVVMLIMTMLET